MGYLISSLSGAFSLILNPTGEFLSIIVLTFVVSLAALLLAVLFGLPLARITTLRQFPGRGAVVEGVNMLAGVPPVVVGLFIYILVSLDGPFGFMGLLHTPTAMIMAQFVVAFPIVTGHTRAALLRVDPTVMLGARTLGASPGQIRRIVVREARHAIYIAVLAAFGRAMSEVGAILVVGGNIAGSTRVMTTTIAVETGKGDIHLVLALGIILFFVSIIAGLLQCWLRKRLRYET